MSWEIEFKFRVASFAAIERSLAEQGIEIGPPVEQADHYLNHPERDFAVTDEALRVRQQDELCFITYKGPKLDKMSKTRREIEFAIDGADHTKALELLQALGFRLVASVRKSRREAVLSGAPSWRHDTPIHLVLDSVDGLGSFVEVEVTADSEQYQQLRDDLFAVAKTFGLEQTERRSYLELLFA